MPPTVSIWAGALSLLGAVAGVLIAQIWTTRREDRNWERQREMYAQQREDQRARDAEQRQDQRERDYQAWLREDRHRFASDKRGVYAEFLGHTNKSILAIRYVAAAVLSESQRREHENEAPIAHIGRLLDDHDLYDHMTEPRDKLGETLNLLRLLAPAAVVDQAEKVYDSLESAESQLAREGKIQDSVHGVNDVVTLGRELREAMRKDLGVVESA
jgi:hypothetical protein